MNWYARVKSAMPLSNEPVGDVYDIGHCGFHADEKCPPEELWYIDNDWKMYREDVTPDMSHGDQWKDFQYDKHIAHGRYQKEANGGGSASMCIHQTQTLNPRRVEYIQNKVVQMLEQTYGPNTVIKNYPREEWLY